LTLTAKDVAEIVRILEESSFDSLSLEMDGIKLNLQRGSTAAPPPAASSSAGMVTTSGSVAARPTTEDVRASADGLIDIPSPLLGIFHRAPKPGAPPFVEVGSKVEEETVIGIIEVMKLMNSVPAGVKGEVVEIRAENGAAVEYGQILLRVRQEA
jgi:acetyl-CoA carboxylase biotin carboxyl carrier protein